jgi:hypothetical protein
VFDPALPAGGEASFRFKEYPGHFTAKMILSHVGRISSRALAAYTADVAGKGKAIAMAKTGSVSEPAYTVLPAGKKRILPNMLVISGVTVLKIRVSGRPPERVE